MPEEKKPLTLKEREAEKAALIAKFDASLREGTTKTKYARTERRATERLWPGHMIRGWQGHWIRDAESFREPKSKNPDKRLRLLAQHHLQLYPVPEVFWTALPTMAERRANEVRQFVPDRMRLLICALQGGSLYKEHTKEFLTKRETHFLLTCPIAFPSLEHGCWYAVARVEGASVGVAAAIAKSKLNRYPFDEFWRYVARWFAKNPVSMNIITDYVDWINAKHTENPGFKLAGATVESLRKRVEDWHRDLARVKGIGEGSWEGHLIETFWLARGPEDKRTKWCCEQIKDAKTLAAEGNRMRHCVYWYKAACISGQISVWSLKFRNPQNEQWYHALTLEVTNSGSIVQARGIANRLPKPEEAAVVREFASHNALAWNY